MNADDWCKCRGDGPGFTTITSAQRDRAFKSNHTILIYQATVHDQARVSVHVPRSCTSGVRIALSGSSMSLPSGAHEMAGIRIHIRGLSSENRRYRRGPPEQRKRKHRKHSDPVH